jgi:Fe-S cluster assembly iron-binding protein IscA
MGEGIRKLETQGTRKLVRMTMDNVEPPQPKILKSLDDFNFTPTDENPILLTRSAVLAIQRELMKNSCQYLRLSAREDERECVRHDMICEDTIMEKDTTHLLKGVTLVIARDDLVRLRGTVIDYLSNFTGTGFRFYNPNIPERKIIPGQEPKTKRSRR